MRTKSWKRGLEKRISHDENLNIGSRSPGNRLNGTILNVLELKVYAFGYKNSELLANTLKHRRYKRRIVSI